VVAEGGEGFVEGALVYGHIERVEQTPGAAHWDLWVRPAMPPDLPHTVVVLTAELATAGWTPREATR
jgi:hypothetical protein